MVTTRRTSKRRFLLTVLVLSAITIVTIYYRGHARSLVANVKSVSLDVIDPVGHFVASIAHPVEHFVQGVESYGTLSKENAKLFQQNQQLRSELGASALNQSEANQLKAQANLPYLQGIPTLRADVILSTPSNFESSIVIDKGSDSGIADGMPVVSGSGLVGLVEQTASSSAVIMLITDPSMKIGVRFNAGKTQGEQVSVLDGEGYGNPLQAEYISPVDILKKGEIMFTSGLQGGLFPPDIPVGKIVNISNGSGTVTPRVDLTPEANLANLQYVSVLLWEPSN